MRMGPELKILHAGALKKPINQFVELFKKLIIT